jgi:DNA-binding NtrC family response regulator
LADVALKRLKYEQFDLIITDLRMPGTSGLDLIRHVHRTNPATRTMLITAFGSSEIENQARQLGAAFLRKPFGLQQFYAVVQDSLTEEQRPQSPAQISNEEKETDRTRCGLTTD